MNCDPFSGADLFALGLEKPLERVIEAVVTARYVYISDGGPFTVSIRDRPYYYLLSVRAYVNDHRHKRALRSDLTARVVEQLQAEGIPKPR